MKKLIDSTLIIVMAGLFLAHFILIQLFGSVLIYEPSSIGLAFEIALMTLIVGFGIWRFITCVKIERNHSA